MALSAVTPQTSQDNTESGVAKNGNSAAELKNEFLTLMVAQVKNQDPLNPLDGAEYVSQLAQFSTVEGIQNMGQLQNQNNILMDTLQVLQSTQLVGQEVSVQADRLELTASATVKGSVDLPEPADQVLVLVRGEDGRTAKQVDLGARGTGPVDFTLPELKPGHYTIDVITRRGEFQNAYVPSLHRPVEKVTVPPDGGDVRLQVSGIGELSLFNISEFLGARS